MLERREHIRPSREAEIAGWRSTNGLAQVNQHNNRRESYRSLRTCKTEQCWKSQGVHMLDSATPPNPDPQRSVLGLQPNILQPNILRYKNIISLSELGWAVLLPQPLNSPILLTDLNPVKLRTQL